MAANASLMLIASLPAMNQPSLSSNERRAFVATVRRFYRAHGRHDLPWRQTTDPYRILVSEVMLQQTQVERVISKYRAFLKQFPSARALAKASLKDVLVAWQGLGYNRRAKLLHQSALEVTEVHNGRFPRTFVGLQALPGIGPYTAGAVMAFAYNKPVPLAETNVRTVYLHHFFHDDTDVSDRDILALVTATLDQKHPREWYWGLMDYGAYLKKTVGNLNTKSKHYTKQSTFKGSDRQIRGAIIRELSQSARTRAQLLQLLSGFSDLRVDAQVERLLREEMVEQKRGRFRLPD